eukprot:COSAG02_NODE_12145_length_1590_cov_1.036217_1_plen_75_part_00
MLCVLNDTEGGSRRGPNIPGTLGIRGMPNAQSTAGAVLIQLHVVAQAQLARCIEYARAHKQPQLLAELCGGDLL